MYAFVLRPRWIVLHVLLVGAVGTFALAGYWQLQRLGERRERNELVAVRRALPPVADVEGDDLEHRRARLRGTYDRDDEVVLLGRGSAIGPGNHLLTPLVLEPGRAVLVDRGLIPGDLIRPPVPRAAPPRGEVLVEGYLMASEGAGPLAGGDDRPLTAVSRVDLERLDRQVPYELAPVYLLLDAQRPEGGELPRPVPPPELGEGSHLSYAVQWFSFIPVALVVYGVLVRREAAKRERAPIA